MGTTRQTGIDHFPHQFPRHSAPDSKTLQVVNGNCSTICPILEETHLLLSQASRKQTHGQTTTTEPLQGLWCERWPLIEDTEKASRKDDVMPVLSHVVWTLRKNRIPSKSNEQMILVLRREMAWPTHGKETPGITEA